MQQNDFAAGEPFCQSRQHPFRVLLGRVVAAPAPGNEAKPSTQLREARAAGFGSRLEPESTWVDSPTEIRADS